jgi:hypothetical protein
VIEMTDLTTTVRPTPARAVAPIPAVASTVAAVEPTLITEQQVLFSTAAAIAPPPARTRRWTGVFGSFATALRKAAGPPQPVPHHHSERFAYLETALLAREMGRL